MDDAEHIVAFLDRVDDDSNCVKVINFGQCLVLLIHFIIDAVNMLYAAFNFGPRKLGPMRSSSFFMMPSKKLSRSEARASNSRLISAYPMGSR